MKKLTFIAIVSGVCIVQIHSNAQGIYAGVAAGYAFPSQTHAFFSDVNSTATSTSVTSKSYSLGQGVPIDIYGGYMFTNNIGLELNISEKFNSSMSSTNTSPVTPPPNTIETDIYTRKGSVLGFTPAIRLSVGGDKLNVYSVTGLFIGVPSSTLEDNETAVTTTGTGGTTINTYDRIYTFSGNVIIGFHGAIGVMYNMSDRIAIFAEVAGNYENWGPSERLITSYTLNGADGLSSLTTSQKQTNYADSYTSYTNNSSPGSPNEAAKIYLPFSSWGINVGVHFAFGGNTAAAAK